MTLRILLGALLGGIAIFLGGCVTHNVLPITDNELKPIPGEFTVMPTLRSLVPGPGVYIFPGMDGVNQKDQAAMSAYQEKIKDLPHGLVVMSGRPGVVTGPKLGIQFLGDLLAALVAAVLLALAPLGSYVRRLFFVAILGLYAGFLIDFPLWNWYGFTSAFASYDILDHVLRSLAGGLVLAAVVKPAVRK